MCEPFFCVFLHPFTKPEYILHFLHIHHIRFFFAVQHTGEHGDSSVCTLRHATVMGISPLLLRDDWPSNEKGSTRPSGQLETSIRANVTNKAYRIIQKKKATNFGIATILTSLVRCILSGERKLFSVGKLLDGEYDPEFKGVYCSVPCILSNKGVERSLEFPLSEKEKKLLGESVEVLKKNCQIALDAIGMGTIKE